MHQNSNTKIYKKNLAYTRHKISRLMQNITHTKKDWHFFWQTKKNVNKTFCFFCLFKIITIWQNVFAKKKCCPNKMVKRYFNDGAVVAFGGIFGAFKVPLAPSPPLLALSAVQCHVSLVINPNGLRHRPSPSNYPIIHRRLIHRRVATKTQQK